MMLQRPHDRQALATPDISAPAVPDDNTPATLVENVSETPCVADLEALLVFS